jgi:ATP-dependent DNA ligase
MGWLPAIVFRGKDDVYIQSRDSRPLDRYFPELHDAAARALSRRLRGRRRDRDRDRARLDFDVLQLRLHPAASRVEAAKETPPSFVAFDAARSRRTQSHGSRKRSVRAASKKLLAKCEPPCYLTPVHAATMDALDWLTRFEGAGLDGVIAKPDSARYQPGKRAMIK